MPKKKPSKTFGQLLREKRVEKGFSLRKFAALVGVSPTYISQVEQDNNDPPTTDRIKKMAELLEEDADEWIALAGRVADDLPDIVREAPTIMPDLLRSLRGLRPDQLEKLRDTAERFKKDNPSDR
jgi:HTH-type transcriptional regulator, competence development regulator